MAFLNRLYSRCRLGGFLCLALYISLSLCGFGQQYVVNGRLNKPLNANIYLTVFDGDTTYHNSRYHAWDKFRFSGRVAEPVLAAISSKSLPQPIYFFIENSNITIDIDVDDPAKCSIVGSRLNSQFRYVLEPCEGENTEACLASYVENNPTSIFSTFLLSEKLYTLPMDEQVALFQRLDGPARKAYHYHVLARRLNQMQSVAEGAKVPNVGYVDTAGRTVWYDSLRSSSKYNIVLVGASWCEQCMRAETQLAQHSQWAAWQLIHIDRQPAAWDAECIKQLSIDHIPYIIVADKDGKIVARDVRVWELGNFDIK